jgi:hypothetical protein
MLLVNDSVLRHLCGARLIPVRRILIHDFSPLTRLRRERAAEKAIPRNFFLRALFLLHPPGNKA